MNTTKLSEFGEARKNLRIRPNYVLAECKFFGCFLGAELTDCSQEPQHNKEVLTSDQRKLSVLKSKFGLVEMCELFFVGAGQKLQKPKTFHFLENL